jgi:DNA-binding transcriptional LysR family regulator
VESITALRAFARLVERGSFTAVADTLHVKQSTVSKWLRALETELGVQLVARTTRAVHVTEAGRQLYPRAVAAVEAYERAMQGPGEDATLRGRVRMSLPEVFGRRHVVPLIATFAQRHEALELDLAFSDPYVRVVAEGFDLVLRVGRSPDSALRSHPLARTPRRLVASPGYVRRHGAPEHPRDLAMHACLLHSGAFGDSWSFSRNGKQHRVRVRGRLSASNSEATLALARRGLGICLLASWLVDADLRAGRLVPLLEPYAAPSARIAALTPPGRHLSAPVRALIDHLRDGLSSLV